MILFLINQSMTKGLDIYSMYQDSDIILKATFYGAGRLASQGSSFSWTKSGLSSWGQCPTPSSKKRFTVGSWAGNDEKYLPTGPSIGVNGSWSPHKSKTGKFILGINWTGLGPGGPVMIETKASRAPSSSAGLLIICRSEAACSAIKLLNNYILMLKIVYKNEEIKFRNINNKLEEFIIFWLLSLSSNYSKIKQTKRI